MLLAMDVGLLCRHRHHGALPTVLAFPPLSGVSATPRRCSGRPVLALAAGRRDVAGCTAGGTPWRRLLAEQTNAREQHRF